LGSHTAKQFLFTADFQCQNSAITLKTCDYL
jgi:hypothetical protein